MKLSRTLASLAGCVLLMLSAIPSTASAGLMAGDVAVIGLHSDNPDQFAWVPLAPLAAGQELYFTDAGWIDGNFSGQSAATSDGGVKFVVPSGGIPAGTIMAADIAASPQEYSAVADPLLGPGFSLATYGDQLTVFTGSPQAPTFLYAMNTAADTWDTTGGSTSANIRSGLYPGLQNGRTAVAVGIGPLPGDESDNARYVGVTSGTQPFLLDEISNLANWDRSDSRFDNLDNGAAAFEILDTEVSPVPEPASALIWASLLIAAVLVHPRGRFVRVLPQLVQKMRNRQRTAASKLVSSPVRPESSAAVGGCSGKPPGHGHPAASADPAVVRR